MAKKLILHVGLHKTGTTAIQRACRDHLKILADSGYYYPLPRLKVDGRPDRHPENHTQIISAAFEKRRFHINGVKPSFVENKELAAMRKAFFMVCNKNCSTILISELISSLSIDELQDFHKFIFDLNLDIHSICVVRKPCSWINSMTFQYVSGRRQFPLYDLESAINRFKSDGAIIRRRIENISHIFPKTTFISFDTLIQAGGPTKWFFGYLGINAEICD